MACCAPALAGDRLLQVAVASFIKVQLRAVAGQVEHLDLGLAPGQPGADLGGAMDRLAVENEEDLAVGVPDKAGEEAEQARCLDRAIQHIQRSSPLLVTAEMRPRPARL